jgi:hypothetical protein
MARQEYDLELRRYSGRGWRAMFFPSGFEHSLTSHAGAAWARSPWEVVQRATRYELSKQTGETAPRDWQETDESPAGAKSAVSQCARVRRYEISSHIGNRRVAASVPRRCPRFCNFSAPDV